MSVPVTDETSAVARSASEPVEVRPCPHGPTLVRGAVSIEHEGTGHLVDRPVVAVCRCTKSSSAPWCDGTHRAIPGY